MAGNKYVHYMYVKQRRTEIMKGNGNEMVIAENNDTWMNSNLNFNIVIPHELSQCRINRIVIIR